MTTRVSTSSLGWASVAMTGIVVLCLLAASSLWADHHEKGEAKDSDKHHEVIESVMNDAHKGKTSLLKRVLAGEASSKEVKKLIAFYIAMEDTKPPQGDLGEWKERTTALTDAAIYLYAKKDGAADALEKASNCKACHSKYKPD